MSASDSGTKAQLSCCAPRRDFLGRIAALGAAAALPGALRAQGTQPYRIDVHHHLIYPGYLDEIAGQRQGAVARWSPAASIEEMDRSGIAVAMLSLIQPGPAVADAEKRRRIARASNEYAAQLVRDHPGRFGSFAALPLTDADASLKEIDDAFGALHAQGIGLMTSYGDKYLGDESFAPVWQELNRRKAVVYIHPLTPACCRNAVKGLPPGVVEFATDTTRAIASLVFSGTAARYPDIRWIFSHSGGTMPFLLSRFTRQELDMKERARERMPRGVLHELAKFHYDTAQGNHYGALAALLRVAPPAQLLFGTDFPFRDGAEEIGGLAAYGFAREDLRAIERDNALRLLPSLKT